MKRVLIFSTSGMGTSLLAHTLRICGMKYGEGTLGWSNTFYYHLERSDIEQAMEDKDEHYIKEVINSYPDHSVIKITHFRKETIEFFLPIVYECMEDDFKLVSFRHPCEIEMGNQRVDNDGQVRIPYNERDPLKVMELQWELLNLHGFEGVLYPVAWDTRYIKTVVNRLGCVWNQDVYENDKSENEGHAICTRCYDASKPTRSTSKERKAYAIDHPDILEIYYKILGEMK